MGFNNIGRVLTTNAVEIDTERVTKKFNDFALSMLWGFLERKPYLSARFRYQREKKLVTKFQNKPDLTTPTLLEADDNELILIFRTLGLTDLVRVFQDPDVPTDDKLLYLQLALQQLHAIHNLNETHGDPYLKNFFLLDETKDIYTCDFEYQRTGPDPAVTDVLILTANAIHALCQEFPGISGAVLASVNEIYGHELWFPFDIRDRIFFSLRFGMGNEFYTHFGKKRTFG